MIRYGLKNFHSEQCKSDFVSAAIEKGRAKQLAKAKRDYAGKQKTARVAHRADKDRVKRRSEWYGDLKTAIHRYVKHFIRKGEPCYTCDLPQRITDNPQAFHVGHFIPAKHADPRRFMLENVRMQCANCNAYNSGRRLEYRAKMIEEMGLEHVEWLECDANHPGLKEQYPHYEDIKAEIAMYRKLIRGSS
jgi:hypothetical protein